MFVRFRQGQYQLQLSLVETRRVDGRVHHEHVASLGSIQTPPTVAGRIAFWERLHERLARLANRIDGETQGKVLGAVHSRVPMVTPDEQRALQLENAKLGAEQWSSIHRVHAATVEDHKGLATTVTNAIANGEAEAAAAAAEAKVAQERVERIGRGEDVEGGLHEPEPFSYESLLKTGFTRELLDHCIQLARLGEDERREVVLETRKRMHKAERLALRAVMRRRVDAAIDEASRELEAETRTDDPAAEPFNRQTTSRKE